MAPPMLGAMPHTPADAPSTAAAIDPSSLPGAEERELLRASLRGFLQAHWPAAEAVRRSNDGTALAALWQGLVGQGVATLGSDPAEGGLREAALVMEELGRAAAPVPALGPLLLNLLLARQGRADAALLRHRERAMRSDHAQRLPAVLVRRRRREVTVSA